MEHRIPYTATASIAYPEDFIRKVKKAKSIRGAKFIHLWISCPAGHKSEERKSVAIARHAVESGIFPLYEVESGTRYTINHEPTFTDVEEYLKLQGRFRHLKKHHIETIRQNIEWEWQRLRAKVEMGAGLPLPPPPVRGPVDEGEREAGRE